MTFPFLSQRSDGVVVRVHAQPGAARSALVGPHGEAFKIRIAAPPEDGRANAELCAFLAAQVGVAKSHVDVILGTASRSKQVLIRDVTLAQVARALHLTS